MTEKETLRILERLRAGEYHIDPGFRNYTGDYDVSVISFDRADGVFLSETCACHPNGEELIRSEPIPEDRLFQRFGNREAAEVEGNMSKTLDFPYRM